MKDIPCVVIKFSKFQMELNKFQFQGRLEVCPFESPRLIYNEQ